MREFVDDYSGGFWGHHVSQLFLGSFFSSFGFFKMESTKKNGLRLAKMQFFSFEIENFLSRLNLCLR